MASSGQQIVLLGLACIFSLASGEDDFGFPSFSLDSLLPAHKADHPCTCGVFLTSQITPGSKSEPRGSAVLLHEHVDTVACNPLGAKHCINRCLDQVVKYLPKSAEILCAAVEEDVHRERAFLFIKDCDEKWVPTNMSAGREFCCKDNKHVKCPPRR